MPVDFLPDSLRLLGIERSIRGSQQLRGGIDLGDVDLHLSNANLYIVLLLVEGW